MTRRAWGWIRADDEKRQCINVYVGTNSGQVMLYRVQCNVREALDTGYVSPVPALSSALCAAPRGGGSPAAGAQASVSTDMSTTLRPGML